MTAETATETVTVELSVETAYEQLVAHEQAFQAFSKAQQDGDKDAALEAAVSGVEAAIVLINEVVPQELADQLHKRLEEEHPELIQEDPLQALIAALMGGDLPFSVEDGGEEK